MDIALHGYMSMGQNDQLYTQIEWLNTQNSADLACSILIPQCFRHPRFPGVPFSLPNINQPQFAAALVVFISEDGIIHGLMIPFFLLGGGPCFYSYLPVMGNLGNPKTITSITIHKYHNWLSEDPKTNRKIGMVHFKGIFHDKNLTIHFWDRFNPPIFRFRLQLHRPQVLEHPEDDWAERGGPCPMRRAVVGWDTARWAAPLGFPWGFPWPWG